MRNRQGYLTPEEVIAVLKAAKEQSARDWAMVLVAYRHGMRASEVCALRMDDVDLKRQVITVRRLKGSLDTVQPLYPHRGVPLLDELAFTGVAPGRWQLQPRPGQAGARASGDQLDDGVRWHVGFAGVGSRGRGYDGDVLRIEVAGRCYLLYSR